MKNKAINTLNYSGIVTLSRIDGAKKIKIAQVHNEGHNPLFKFLADCLVGDFHNIERPAKIKLLKLERSTGEDNVTIEDYKDITGSIHLLKQPKAEYDASRSLVRYSFIIPRDYIEGLDDMNDLWLGLYTLGTSDSDTADFAACCEIALNQSAIAGAALAVDWELIISNLAYYENENKNK